MRYLLDTNTFIYFATDHSKLDKDVTIYNTKNSSCRHELPKKIN